ncbi:MAG: molybdate ABC transporter substrate-binding protein, partial [Acidobacteriota bacterium]|nr:molybdate ABC transporter substrate-binding protein [Acidobacteriota bacterium]
MSVRKSVLLTLCLLLVSGTAAPVQAEEALIAVATNFSKPMKRLHASFEQNGAHRIRVTTGSTGTLYAQILNGAPFDLFLAADQHRPTSLVDRNHAVDGSRFTYAVGQLVLWSPDPDRIHDDGAEILRIGDFRALAIANPALAPY